MKVLLWIVGAIAALVIAAALLIPMLVNEQELIELAARKVESQSGVKIAVTGDASLSLFPKVALTTSGVTVQMPDNGARIEANYLQAGVALLPLLRSSVEMDSITVDGVTITTVAEDAEAARVAELDTSNLSPAELDAFYAAREQAREAGAAQARLEAAAAPLALEVGELTLREVKLRTVDDNGELISELEIRFFTALDLNTAGRPVPLSAQISLTGADAGPPIMVTLEGQARIDAEGGKSTLSDFNVVVEGATPDPVQLVANGTTAMNEQTANLDLSLKIGDLTGSGTVRYSGFESPMIDARLALTRLDPALLVLAGPEAAASAAENEGAGDAGSAEDVPLPLHSLRMIDTRAQLSIDTVVLEGHKLKDVEATLRVVDGVATLKPVTATLHGGEIAFEAVLNGRYNTARVRTEGGVKGLDVAQAVAVMETPMAARGTADLTWSIQGSGRTTGDLTKSLNGPIDFTTADITLEGLAMEQMLCKGIALVIQESLVAEFPTDTRFEALAAKIQLADGVATLDPLTATLPAVSLSGTGALSLETQRLQASLRAQLSEKLGEMDPACRVNERYTDLRWPVECKGTLADDPASWCGVDTTEIVKDLAENEAKRKVKDEAGKLFKKIFE
jgi:uncharacterized protein involved in outer membrane biogenesis